jgi:hypothetical protein
MKNIVIDNKRINPIELARRLGGISTIAMIQERLGIDRARAIYLIYRLRKEGFVKTNYGRDKVRVYRISPLNALKGIDYIDILNKYAPVGLAKSEIYEIYGRIPSIEETLVYAITQKNIRFYIACLALFRQVRDWSELYRLAKGKGIVREVAALYDISRLVVPKVRKMPVRFKNLALPKKTDKYKYLVNGFSSDSFQEIEKKWKVYISLNSSDLDEYRGIHT